MSWIIFPESEGSNPIFSVLTTEESKLFALCIPHNGISAFVCFRNFTHTFLTKFLLIWEIGFIYCLPSIWPAVFFLSDGHETVRKHVLGGKEGLLLHWHCKLWQSELPVWKCGSVLGPAAAGMGCQFGFHLAAKKHFQRCFIYTHGS